MVNNDVLYVSVGGVFTFNEFNLYLAPICEVFDKFPLCVESVSDRTNNVRSMVFEFMVCK